MRPISAKKSRKEERIHEVLLSLVGYYIKHGKPVGSNTLKEVGFPHLGSATLRNYFAYLDQGGFLRQEHSSGGRIPTNRAFRVYANEFANSLIESAFEDERLAGLRKSESREVATYLEGAAETLKEMTNLAVLFSAPRFDQDFVTGMKLVPIDASRCLCVIITDFGMIQTEMIHVEHKLSTVAAGRIEGYFQWRLSGLDEPENLTEEELALAQNIYNELMVRHIVSYSHFTDEEIYRTGLSNMITYPEFQDTAVLANSLALLENSHSMRLMLKETASVGQLKYWIGNDLKPYCKTAPDCTFIAMPYRIGQQNVGAFGIMGPTRLPYKELFTILQRFTDSISEALTRNIYKHKISFRTPEHQMEILQKEEHRMLNQSRLMLLEDQRKASIE